LEIVSAVVAGYANKEIAEYFKISEDTVKHHLSNIFDKLGVFHKVRACLICRKPVSAAQDDYLNRYPHFGAIDCHLRSMAHFPQTHSMSTVE
jgi:hypothetical protein